MNLIKTVVGQLEKAEMAVKLSYNRTRDARRTRMEELSDLARGQMISAIQTFVSINQEIESFGNDRNGRLKTIMFDTKTGITRLDWMHYDEDNIHLNNEPAPRKGK